MEFLSPSPSGIYYFGDTLSVQVQISSVQDIQSAEISLRTMADVPVCPSVYFTPASKSYLLTSPYALKDDGQPAGNYKLVIVASDGINTYMKAQPIYVYSRPKTFRSVFFLTSNGLEVKISRMDTGQVLPFSIVPGDFSGAELSSANHVLFTAGQQTGGLNWLLTGTGEVIRTLPPYAAGIPNFKSTAFFENNFYVSRYDGFLRAYNAFGSQTFSTTENPYYITGQLVKSGDNIFTEVTNSSTSGHGIMVYSYPYGAERQFRLTDFLPEKLLSVSRDSILVFGEKNGRTASWYYFLTTNNYNQIKDFGSIGRVYDALELPSGIVLLSTANGIIAWNRSANLAFMTRSEVVTDMEYESLGRRIFCANGQQAFAMDENYLTIFNAFFSDSLVAIKAEYSR